MLVVNWYSAYPFDSIVANRNARCTQRSSDAFTKILDDRPQAPSSFLTLRSWMAPAVSRQRNTQSHCVLSQSRFVGYNINLSLQHRIARLFSSLCMFLQKPEIYHYFVTSSLSCLMEAYVSALFCVPHSSSSYSYLPLTLLQANACFYLFLHFCELHLQLNDICFLFYAWCRIKPATVHYWSIITSMSTV